MPTFTFPLDRSSGAHTASAASTPSQPKSTGELINDARDFLTSCIISGFITRIEEFFGKEHPKEVIDALTQGDTPVHEAVELRGFGAVDELKKHLPTAFNEKNSHGETPLHIAARIGNIPTTRVLLGETASAVREDNFSYILAAKPNSTQSVGPVINLEERDENGNTALALAAKKGNHELVALLLKAGADPNAQNRFGESPVMVAVMGHNIDVLDTLKRYGADFNLRNNAGELPLHHSLDKGSSLQMIEELLKCKADPNLKDAQGETGLMVAARKKSGAIAATRLLLEPRYGVNVNDTDDQQGTTALFDAVKAGHLEVAKLLLEKGADPMAKDKVGNIPRYFVGEGPRSSAAVKQQMEEVLREAEQLHKS